MNNKTDIDVQYVSPLKKICMTIGELPSSYLETMSYYEMLVWFTEFLRNQVIPTVNNNAEAVQELQSLYEELRTYVNNYFDNLDIQDEVNNKIDAMVTDGTMDLIINQEVFGEINDTLDIMNSDEIIFNGDSWGDETTEWTYLLRNKLVSNSTHGLTNDKVHIWNRSGSSAVSTGQNTTYLQNMENNASQIADKTKVTKIVLCAGANDVSSTQQQIITALQQFHNYCRTNYPNATIYYGCIGWYNEYAHYTERRAIINNVLPGYKAVTSFGGVYMNNIEYVMRNYNSSLWNNYYHPTQAGSEIIAQNVYEFLKTGSTNVNFKTTLAFGNR